MIITLVGADFSKNNIGKLSTWLVQTSFGSGVTHTGAGYVDLGAAYSTTITIAEGYELNGSVTVTMGGNAITEGITVDGNTITISIASVTGNVMIKVPTKNIAGGEVVDPDPEQPENSGSTERVYTINETLKFNDMPEVAATFISDSYYSASNTVEPGSKLTVTTRTNYKAWKNIKLYAGQSYKLYADGRAVVWYDEEDNVLNSISFKAVYPDGVIPADAIKQDCWMSFTVQSSASDDDCTITRLS